MKNMFKILLFFLIIPTFVYSASQNNIKVDKLVIGSPTSSDKTLEFNTGSGSANPKIKINASGGKLQFANDGTNYKDLGSGSGSGSGINLIDNSGFEQGLLGWTSSGGSVSQVTSGSNLLHGTKSVTFDASASGQYIESDAVLIPEILKGQNCLARIYYKGGDSNLTLESLDGSNVQQGFSVLSAKTSVYPATVNFPCPSSGSLKLRVRSTGDAALIAIDNVTLGQADNIVQATSQVQTTYSAQINSIPLSTATGLSAATYVAKSNSSFIQSFDVAQSSTVWYIQVNFVAGTFTDIPTCVVSSNNATVASGLVAVSSNVFQATTSYVRFTPYYAWTSGNQQPAPINIVCQKSGSDFTGSVQQSMGYKPDQVAWRVDANIGGGNLNLGTANVSSYTGAEGTSLDLVNNAGSGVISAQIPCSGTNSPTGLTCAVGNESVGVSFNLPVAGEVLACASVTRYLQASTASNLTQTLQLVETPNNAQTILQEGKSRVASYAAASATHLLPDRVCGTFSFSSSGQKTIRLMYEQEVIGTVSSGIYADRSATTGQRDIHFEVYPLNNYSPAPLLVGSVITGNTGIMRIESAQVDAAGVVSNETSDFLNGNCAVSDTSSYACSFNAGVFSVAPNCQAVVTNASTTEITSARVNGLVTTSLLSVRTGFGNFTKGAYPFTIFCMGQR